nr:hypothetical protein [Frankia sp. Cr1]
MDPDVFHLAEPDIGDPPFRDHPLYEPDRCTEDFSRLFDRK